jgi:signal transduction histidine kinase
MPRRRSIGVVLAVWAVVGLIWAVDYWVKGREFLRGGPVPFPRAVLFLVSYAFVWAALTPLVVALLRAHPLAPGRIAAGLGVQLAAMPLFAFAAESVWATLFIPFMRRFPDGAGFLAEIRSNFLYDTGTNLQTYLAVVGIAWGLDAWRAGLEKERRAAALETELVRAELVALKAQLRPHFLFNALNSVMTLMHRDVDAASRTLAELGALLRLSLAGDGAPHVALASELDFLKRYLAIEEVRFSDRLSVRFDVPPETLAAEVPQLVLQPLAENAVRHGIAARPGRGVIEVSARRVGDALVLAVRDDGPGPGAPRPKGIGLANTRARLERLYGEAASLELSAHPDGGTEAIVRLPFRAAEEVTGDGDDQDAPRRRRAAGA